MCIYMYTYCVCVCIWGSTANIKDNQKKVTWDKMYFLSRRDKCAWEGRLCICIC